MARRKVVKLVSSRPLPRDADARMIDTLVWALDLARKGKLNYFAAVFDSEGGDEAHTVELGRAASTDMYIHMLGAVRMLEQGLIRRHLEDREEAMGGAG